MRWPPFKHVFFDCDSTLTTVEGIDALAESAGKGWRIGVLTEAAMEGMVDLEEVYAKRLKLLKPTRGQINMVRQIYKNNIVTDAAEVIEALQHLGHQVYIISGGLEEPVVEFGAFLGVPRKHIRAVTVEYDQLSGEWWQGDDERPNTAERYMAHIDNQLTVSDGKAKIVRELIGDQHGQSLLIGDGVSDLLAGRAVDLFIGFGGVIDRPRVRNEAPAFINSHSIAPLLAMAGGPAAIKQLQDSKYQPLLDRTANLISNGAVEFKSERLKEKFNNAWQAAH
jgi:phosphoserine phosphatase